MTQTGRSHTRKMFDVLSLVADLVVTAGAIAAIWYREWDLAIVALLILVVFTLQYILTAIRENHG